MLPRFPRETILIIEPTLELQDKDFALIQAGEENKAQFKQVLFDGNDLYLKPLNSDFEVKRIHPSYKVLGVMVQALTEFYQDRIPSNHFNQEAETASPIKKRKGNPVAELEEL